MYKSIIRPRLFALSQDDAEIAHEHGLAALRFLGKTPLRQILTILLRVHKPRTVFGLIFPNPIGMAAGFDKNAEVLPGLAALGFGFVEAGTVTVYPQEGKPRPRMFRLEEDRAMINRMGFNNHGSEAMAKNLASRPKLGIPVGISIGKSANAKLGYETITEYVILADRLAPLADYLVLNISSPNTKDIRGLQERGALAALGVRVSQALAAHAMRENEDKKPLLFKIAPDVNDQQMNDILALTEAYADGLIISNTTVARPESLRSPHKSEIGGLSGPPLLSQALHLIAYAHKLLPKMPLIGVGGIETPDDVARMIDAGATLGQLFTALIYQGPLLPYRLNRSLLRY